MKKRAFDAEEIAETGVEVPAPPARTEPAPWARTAAGLVVASWLVPLPIIASLFTYSESEPGSQLLHRVLTFTSVALLLVGLGLAIRGIDVGRKDPRVRRRMAVAALVLALLTPVVWTSELLFAWEVFLVRERRDAAERASDGSSAPAE